VTGTLPPVRQTGSSSAAARDAWPSYAAIAAVGYVVYGVGAIAPYLRTQLGLSGAEVGLHSTALATGLVLSGAVAAGLDRRFGEVSVRGAAIGGLTVAVVTLAIAPALGVTLAAAVLVGLGTGTLLGFANAVLGRPGGQSARLRVARANVWAMVSAFVCPVVLAAAASNGLPWALGLAPALALLVILGLDLRAGPRLRRDTGTDASGRLPSGYWLAWAFLVAAIAVEFSIVFWGATLIEGRTGVDTAVATLLGGLFLGGMFVGRLAQSAGLGTAGDLRRPAAIGVLLAGLGTLIAWVSTTPALSGTALFVAGLGVAGLYPLGVAAALAAAPGQLTLAGTRLTLASGTAILVAPFALGVAADATGVTIAWGLVVVLAIAALVLVAGLPDGTTRDIESVISAIG
jgi:MFS family permease